MDAERNGAATCDDSARGRSSGPGGRRSADWVRALLRWYRRRRRDLPWRGTTDPYAVWVSEVMLQQTQVKTVIPFYLRFLARFPDVRALAASDVESVLRLWQGLGYYSRARNLREAARRIVAEHGGVIPRSAADLARLPGVGAYTAAAVASICFGEAVPVLDGNVVRVVARLDAMRDDVRQGRVRRAMLERLAGWVPRSAPGDFNQAMMELGATVCTPRSPDCARCPVTSTCVALRLGLTEALPVVRKRTAAPLREEVAAVIERRGRLLLAARPETGLLGGLYGLPGGRREPGEPLPAALRRIVEQRTSLAVTRARPLGTVAHAYSHFRLRLRVYACDIAARGRPARRDGLRWVNRMRLDSVPLDGATIKAIACLSARDAGSRR